MNAHVESPQGRLAKVNASDGLGMLPRVGEPESNLMPGMAAPRPLAASPAAISGPGAMAMPDTSVPGPVALQSPVWWTYDFDPATGIARATFAGKATPASIAPSSGFGAMSATSLTLTTPLAVASGGTNDTGTAWTPYTPTCTAQSGTITAYTATGRYKLIGKTCFWQADVQITNVGTATTALRITLPPSLGMGGDFALATAFDVSIGAAFLVAKMPNASPWCIVQTTGNAFPVAANGQLIVNGTYETV